MVDSPMGALPEHHHQSSAQRRGIFISYRRADSLPYAGRLADDLRGYFATDHIYRDIDSNRVGVDYTRTVDEALANSRVVLAIVGPQWLAAVDTGGAPRLNNPEDLVRIELERALTSGIAVVPVLVGGAGMPTAANLPDSLRSFAQLHALRLSDEDWPYDFGRLLETLTNYGVLPAAPGPAPDDRQTLGQAATKVVRYERTLKATRRRAYDALLGAVELLRYPRTSTDLEAAQIEFTAAKRTVTAKVIDAQPGHSTVVLEFTSLSLKGAGGGGVLATLMLGPLGLLAAAGGYGGLRALDKRFAVGFLDNVQRVLEGRPIGEDSAVLPGVEKWREANRSRKV